MIISRTSCKQNLNSRAQKIKNFYRLRSGYTDHVDFDICASRWLQCHCAKAQEIGGNRTHGKQFFGKLSITKCHLFTGISTPDNKIHQPEGTQARRGNSQYEPLHGEARFVVVFSVFCRGLFLAYGSIHQG
jgi:hypothetical protein